MLNHRTFTTTATRWAKKGRGAHQGKGLVFRNVFFAVSLPVILLLTGRAVMHAHSEEPKERMPFVPYEFLRRRTKRFPWGEGNKSLFHNPHTNALPDGYEDEHEHADGDEEH